MAASNYDDVLHQLHAAGLHVDRLEVTGKIVRCKVEGDREKRGWYSLHEFTTSRGDVLIVGSFGQWRGAENFAQRIELKSQKMDPGEVAALKRRLADDRKAADAAQAATHKRAAEAASLMWAKLSEDGDSDYLAAKKVQGYGLRYSPRGGAVLPVLDTQGRIHGLQILRTPAAAERERKPAKEFWPKGVAKKGHFHLIGSPAWIVLIAEGYATAASLHAATGHPVAVAFDAGNLAPVADALRKRYPQTKILLCADNDDLGKCRHDDCRGRVALAQHPVECPHCGKEHGYTNAGVGAASSAALAVKGGWVAPTFADPDARIAAYLERGSKPTDFNDLHVDEGLHVVRVQVEAHLTALRWNPKVPTAAATTTSGGGAPLRPIETTQELMERFALVASTPVAVFDRQEHRLRTLADMREMCTFKWVHRGWSESTERQIVRDSEVGFDPTGQDTSVTCNLYAGWPTVPKEGSCERLLDLLRYMCSEDRNPAALYQWLLRWIAYPIQHPGAKMKTTLVLHGPQGAGKNLFFEAVMKIYGEYGDVLDQAAVEDKFNDWASRKLFMIADEVVARSGAYHIKNQLKSLITGDRIRINPKNMAAHWERNHLNLVFLSNESMPVVIEEDDRRHCVVWTPGKESREYYQKVMAEIAAGGVAALHHYLLHMDLGDFDNGTLPPKTEAKQELIKLGLDSPVRFYDELMLEEIPKVDPMPGLTTDWYQLYRTWCAKHGYHMAPEAKFVIALTRQRGVQKLRKRYTPGAEERGPHWFLFLGAANPPEGQSQANWLGTCYARVREQLEDYKGRPQGAGGGA
jgi:putative DNA primase/helicase